MDTPDQSVAVGDEATIDVAGEADHDGGFVPLGVYIECQGFGRVDACTFVRGDLDDLDVVTFVPRGRADVVVYLDVTERQNDDLWLIRATSSLPGAPSEFEQIAAVDSRTPVDAQQAALEAPLRRVLAPFVSAHDPEAVSVTLARPEQQVAEDRKTTPWGASAWIGGYGSWTEQYQSLDVWSGSTLFRVTTDDAALVGAYYNRSIERQPSLSVDGELVPLTYDSEKISANALVARNLTGSWTVGLVGRGGHDDPDGQYDLTWRAHAGVEHNWFASDDDRGNRLSLAYLAGVQGDQYHHVNQLGETEAVFPTHLLLFQGDVQFDRTSLWVDTGASAELLHPDQRYVLSADGGVSLGVGSNLDFELNLGVTQQAIPGPADVDQGDFEQVTRASYAQPLQTWGNLNLRVHFDPTNGARNDRFDAAAELGNTANL